MFHARYAAVLIAAVLLGMFNINAAAHATNRAGGLLGGDTAIFQDFEGTITRIGAKEIVIDGVSFPYGWLVNPDIAPVSLGKFFAGDCVFFQVNQQGRIVKIDSMPKAAQPGWQRKLTPGESAGSSKPASVPAKPVPLKQQNRVWTN
jgi:hypothetical protein